MTDGKPPQDKTEDIVISNAEYRVLVEVPGYKLRKGIEVALFDETSSGGTYGAVHFLPSDSGDAKGTGIQARGKTPDEACSELARILSERATHLKRWRRQKNLSGQCMLELKYFNSIMIPESEKSS